MSKEGEKKREKENESERRRERKRVRERLEDYWAQCKGVEWFLSGNCPEGGLKRLEKFLKENSLMIKKAKKKKKEKRLEKKIRLTRKISKKNC